MKSIIASLKNRFFPHSRFSSSDYWDERYKSGGNSGPGSYGQLAQFKAAFLNALVKDNGITSVIEFGCGDGNQLALALYPRYSGYDVSLAAVKACRLLFENDSSKDFFLAQGYDGRKADLALSLDVIFHLTEDHIFDAYMHRLFEASSKYVVVYSSDLDEPIQSASVHVRHRHFTKWIDQEISSEWGLMQRIPNA
ncbi:class I SAM-dependent methyltransferase, partial [Dyella sp.]|uniref:class I SAM-dependent methyltransferase n=1 Tax=Dyella sp. TaxID=1869338 RepID=UPI002D79ED4B